MTDERSGFELAKELEELRARLVEAEEALRAIRTGDVDAVVVCGARGEQVYTLSGAESVYRQLVETMSEGAVTLSMDGVILYCNARLTEMLGRPFDRVLGTALRDHLSPADQQALDGILAQARTAPCRREICLESGDGRLVPVYLSASRLHSEGAKTVFCLVFTDLTEQKSHEQIAAAERLARLILEQAAEAIIVCDEHGRVIRASEAAQRFCDGSPNLRSFAAAFPLRKDDSEPFHIAPVLQGETLRNVEVVLERREQRLALILNAGPLFSDRQIFGCVVTLTDITERKRTEHDLSVSETRYHRLFEAAKDGILILDAETGQIVDVNPFLVELTGYSNEELLGKHLWEIGPFSDIAASKESFAELQTEKYVRYEDLPLKTRDGRKIAVEFVSNVYLVGGKKVIQCNIRDITVRKRAEEAVRAGELRYRTLVDNANESIIVAQDGLLKYVNPVTLDLLGVSEQDLIDKPFPEFIHPDDRSMVVERYRQRIASEAAQSRYEFRVISRDGITKWVEINATLIEWQGRPATLNFLTDITDRNRADEARERLEGQLRTSQKMEAIGSLAGGIAHDFNNLLSVILSYTGFALDAVPEGEPLREDLLEVKNAGERSTVLVRQLLAFSRKQILEPKPLDLNRIALDLEKMLRRILGEDVDFVQALAPDLGLTFADPGQIEQVLMNLVVNARDAMPGGGKLTIETANVVLDDEYAASHTTVEPGPYVMLAVTDTGCGMDAETQARIFEPFFTTKETGKGTGLGLSMVYGIVKQSGGNLCVYSEPSHGTTFKIYLPRMTSPAAVEVKTTLARTQLTGTETVLVVEDEDAILNLARRILGAAGYTVLTAASGAEALATCERHPEKIHLVLTDVVMPEMGGRVFAERLAKLRPGIKVVYMSGYTDDAIVHHGTLDPGTRFIGKPFNAADLTRKVREVLDEG